MRTKFFFIHGALTGSTYIIAFYSAPRDDRSHFSSLNRTLAKNADACIIWRRPEKGPFDSICLNKIRCRPLLFELTPNEIYGTSETLFWDIPVSLLYKYIFFHSQAKEQVIFKSNSSVFVYFSFGMFSKYCNNFSYTNSVK